MRTNIVEDIQQLFKNKVLNMLGVERDLTTLLADKDVEKAIELMQDRDEEVDNALKEYIPQRHKVMHRPDKHRDKGEPYITEKLPRNLQSYINEVELFFLLGQPPIFKKKNGDDEAFQLFNDFWKKNRLNARIRKVKRLAGAETESAMIFNIYQDEGEIKVLPFVAARSTGYKLRPLFDQYMQMQAMAIGYTLKESARNVEHWDIYTKSTIYYCKKGALGWEVSPFDNPIGKIPGIYFQQRKPWMGVEKRLDRIEELDSKTADTNNYFSDPIAAATADVVQNLASPDKPGRLIQLTGKESTFTYVTPPNGSQPRLEEKTELKETVLFDTMTPNFDIEKMKGFGTLTGAAIKNTFAIGYIKRDNLKEDYDEYLDRLISVIKSILIFVNPTKRRQIEELDIEHEFADPFSADKADRWKDIQSLYGSGLCSLETGVSEIGLVDDPDDEVARIHCAEMDKVFTANEAKGEPTPSMAEQDEENKTGIRPVAQPNTEE